MVETDNQITSVVKECGIHYFYNVAELECVKLLQ